MLFNPNLADEGKAYEQGFDDGVKAVLRDLIGHTLQNSEDGCEWTWTINKKDIQFIVDKYKVEAEK